MNAMPPKLPLIWTDERMTQEQETTQLGSIGIGVTLAKIPIYLTS
jgi:hypothetical protein